MPAKVQSHKPLASAPYCDASLHTSRVLPSPRCRLTMRRQLVSSDQKRAEVEKKRAEDQRRAEDKKKRAEELLARQARLRKSASGGGRGSSGSGGESGHWRLLAPRLRDVLELPARPAPLEAFCGSPVVFLDGLDKAGADRRPPEPAGAWSGEGGGIASRKIPSLLRSHSPKCIQRACAQRPLGSMGWLLGVA